MKIKLLLLFLVLSVVSVQVSASQNISLLLDAYDNCNKLKYELLKAKYIQRDNLKAFLERYLGQNNLQNSYEYLFRIAGNGNISNFLNKALETRYPKKKDRRKIVQSFSPILSYIPSVNALRNELSSLIEPLRYPTGKGYKYARYVKEPAGRIARQKLVAFHPIGNFQRYDRTISEHIYRVHIFSPKKSGMFHKNRDTYLQNLTVSYRANGTNQTITKVFNHFLKRGESLDFELPEVAEEASVTLTFGCKPEHRKKAMFYIEFVKAKIIDNQNSPYLGLINTLNRVSFRNKDINTLTSQTSKIMDELKIAIVNSMNEANTIYTNVAVNKPKPLDNDKLRYFMYMLKDSDVTREQLIKKFKSIIKK